MIDVSEVVTDPDLAEPFTIERHSGQFVAGGWTENTPQTVPAFGVVTPSSPDEINAVPEGDRVIGMQTFYSTQEMFKTRGGSTPGTSDVLVWNGEKYRVLQVFDYSNRGCYKAVAARLGGQ